MIYPENCFTFVLSTSNLRCSISVRVCLLFFGCRNRVRRVVVFVVVFSNWLVFGVFGIMNYVVEIYSILCIFRYFQCNVLFKVPRGI